VWSVRRRSYKGFSLLEVVIVVAIIAALAAIAIPRMSRAAKSTNDSAVNADLAVLRKAIDFYATEHLGVYPEAANINEQLIQFTNISGDVSITKDTTHTFGPYLRSIPSLPVGARIGGTKIAASDANDVGWIYVKNSGSINANTTTEADDAGKLYKDY